MEDSKYTRYLLLFIRLPKVKMTIVPHSHVFTGETVTLKCEIESLSGWTYKWFKGSTPDLVFESEGNTFTINAAAYSDEGQYWCQGERKDRPTSSETSGIIFLVVQGTAVKPRLSLEGTLPLLTGHDVTLSCELQSTGWLFYFYKTTSDSKPVSVSEVNSYSISSVKVSDGGQYWCRAGRGDPVYHTPYSNEVWVNVTERPKAVVSLQYNWTEVFRGETVTLRCDIKTKGNPDWEYSWYKKGSSLSGNQNLYTFTATSVYKDTFTCKGTKRPNGVRQRPTAVLRRLPQTWFTEGDLVTLSCEVRGSTTGWRFHWYKTAPYSPELLLVILESRGYYLQLVSDSISGAGGSYTLSPAALRHTGVYVCRAERGEPAYHTQFSKAQPLFITGRSSASLVIRPNRTQHFTTKSLSLSCEVQDNSTGWRLRWFTKRGEISECPSSWTTAVGPRCSTAQLLTSDSGVYWCQSDCKYSHIVNITVHNGPVIIDSPAYPVTEGDPLSLRCIYRSPPPDFHANFFKDRSPLKNHTSGEMTIAAVSKKDEGYYQCENGLKGMSPEVWVTVEEYGSSKMLAVGVGIGVVLVAVFILVTMLVLLFYSKKFKGLHEHTAMFGHEEQSTNQGLNQHLNQNRQGFTQSATADVYATVNRQNRDEDEATAGSTAGSAADLTYAQIELKHIKNKQRFKNDNAGDVTYAEVNVQAKQLITTDL